MIKKTAWLGIFFLFCCPLLAMQSSEAQELQDAKRIAQEAGKKILEIRKSGQLVSQDVNLPNGKKVRQTNADIEAGRYIIQELTKKYPKDGMISQDQMDHDPSWFKKERVWLINPIDGTKEFEGGGDDFLVQIGLLIQNEAVIGVSYYPATDTYIYAVKGQGAWLEKEGKKQKLMTQPCQEKILLQSSSHSIIETHFKEWGWIPTQTITQHLSTTSRLLKIIQGEATLYITLGASPLGTEKKGGVWNYGANVVIANESALFLKTLKGQPINLRQPEGLLVEGVVITNDSNLYQKVIQTDWKIK